MKTVVDNLTEAVSLVPLTQNTDAIVDAEDLISLSECRWNVSSQGKLRYARRKNKGKTVYMHREIMNIPNGVQIDHINGNGLDNRKVNLRICNHSQNQQNRAKRGNKSSRFKGVDWHKLSKKWRARICINRKRIHIGYYNSENEAAKAYDQKAVELFGEFARLNFPSQKT